MEGDKPAHTGRLWCVSAHGMCTRHRYMSNRGHKSCEADKVWDAVRSPALS